METLQDDRVTTCKAHAVTLEKRKLKFQYLYQLLAEHMLCLHHLSWGKMTCCRKCVTKFENFAKLEAMPLMHKHISDPNYNIIYQYPIISVAPGAVVLITGVGGFSPSSERPRGVFLLHYIHGQPVTAMVQRVEIHKLCQGENLILGFSIRGGINQDPSQNPSSEDKTDKGIYVTRVSEGGPGEIAGLQIGDKIIQGNGWDMTMVTHDQAQKRLTKRSEEVVCLLVTRQSLQKAVQQSMCPSSLP
ncbi:tax1-binding protein 3-like [Dipodomys spectabilis]|uniref:tax1-binding protein 3-like n=1 Tax=Dipodomys spectabilis TaxID=105255 RepID=UPI001C544C5D|nr:tax1-binding protein 3-like [Dipodomys spectabilis]